jgi:hypothetical protein
MGPGYHFEDLDNEKEENTIAYWALRYRHELISDLEFSTMTPSTPT